MNNSPRISIRLPPVVLEELRRQAQELEIDLSELVRDLITSRRRLQIKRMSVKVDAPARMGRPRLS